jgi:putative ABC transport system permease protein
MWRSVRFDRSELMRALGHAEVVSAYPMYMGLAPFKDTETRTKRTLVVYGYDVETNLMAIKAIQDKREQLRLQDTILFDESSRPEFGPMRQLISEGKDLNEINDHKVKTVGLFQLGISFSADANVITNDLNFLRIFPDRSPDKIDMGIIKLVPGANVEQVKSELMARLNKNINFFTLDQLVESEKLYWQIRTPIGFIFGFGTIMGLVVGMVIVYQILFTDITNHLNEFATLKAMGYKNSYFVRVVFASAFFLAVLGFIPGFILSFGLYRLAEGQIFMPMPMTLGRISTIFLFILSMCATAGMLAMRKLKAANPADMF